MVDTEEVLWAAGKVDNISLLPTICIVIGTPRRVSFTTYCAT